MYERSQLMLITKKKKKKKEFKTIVLVILSVRVCDLITLLIIATRGQCKDVCVPENVRVGS